MTPTQIAASLTPAQARALRLLRDLSLLPRLAVLLSDEGRWLHAWGLTFGKGITPLGLAVLAALDKGAKP